MTFYWFGLRSASGRNMSLSNYIVMPALGAGIHVFLYSAKTWMAGTSPAMTAGGRQFESAKIGLPAASLISDSQSL